MMKRDRRGNSLLGTLAILTALAIGVYSVGSLVVTESNLVYSTALTEDARQGAESLLQMGMAQVQQDLRSMFNDTPNFNASPLSIDSSFISHFNTIHSANEFIASGNASSEIIGGEVSPSKIVYIDPSEPGNESDSMRGMWVTQKNIELLSKATVENPSAGSSTFHARQILALRDIPLFNYAIFYDLPFEVSPGEKMDVFGKVHINDDAYITSNTASGLTFHDIVTIAGKLYHKNLQNCDCLWDAISMSPVSFSNANGDFVSMQETNLWPAEAQSLLPGTDSWVESDSLSDEDFRELTRLLWDDRVQTEAHGIERLTFEGFEHYIEDTDSNTLAKESRNSSYQIIQPILNKADLDAGKNSTDQDELLKYQKRQLIEKHKYAYKAGLIIEVDAIGNRTYYTYQRSGADPYSGLTYDGFTGEPLKYMLSVDGANVSAAETADTLTSHENFAVSSSTVTGGFWDLRQRKGINVVDLDIGELRQLVEHNKAKDWGAPNNGDADDPRKPENWWNGVVYVKFPQQGTVRQDGVNPAFAGWGLRLINGEHIPDPTFAPAGISGMSVATNQAMYVLGNYNADGIITSNSATHADGVASGVFQDNQDEAPAALISDAITFLSSDWDDSQSGSHPRVGSSIEISAAIVAGIVPTHEWGTSTISGGLQNFPITLESNNGMPFTIRGSLVVLFESEVARGEYVNGSHFMNDSTQPYLGKGIPSRMWGYHKGFEQGMMPPGTPYFRKFRSSDFDIISAGDYDARVTELNATP